MHISLAHTADSSGRFRWIASTMTPPSNPPAVSSTGTMSSFGRWIDLSSGSMPRQKRCSKSQRRPDTMARPVVRQAEQGPRSAADRAMPASARLRCAPAHRSGLPPTKRDDDSTKAHRAPADCFGYSRSSLVNSYSPDAAAMSWRCQYQKQKSIMASGSLSHSGSCARRRPSTMI